MNRRVMAARNLRMERHVLAAVGTGGTYAAVIGRVSNRLSPGEREATLARLEAGGAIRRDDNGTMTRDIQAWVNMRSQR